MKILLISANTETINMPLLPLGLAFINAALLAQGFETEMVNLMDAADAKTLSSKELEDWLIKTIYQWAQDRTNCIY